MRISPALTSRSSSSASRVGGDGDLQVLGRPAVGHLGGLRRGSSTSTQPPFDAERGARGVGPQPPAARRSACASSASTASASDGEVRDEQHRRVGAVLGLVQQVGRGEARVGAVVGDHHALGRPEDHHRRHAVALHLDLRAGHRRAAGADDLAHLRDRRRCRSRARRHPPGPLTAEHVARCRACGTRRARPGRSRPLPSGSGGTTSASSRHAGDHRRHGQLVGDARVLALPLGTNSPADVIGVIFSPTCSPGSLSKLQSAARAISCSLNARRWAMASSIAASTSARPSADGELVVGRPQLVRARASTLSKSRSARHTASSPLARTSSMIRPIAAFRSASKIAVEPAVAQRRAFAARPSPPTSSRRITPSTLPAASQPTGTGA